MRDGGLSKAGLGRLHDLMAGYVERGEVPGAVTVISRRGETHVDAIGAKATDGAEPMRRDAIFRITSMTKPVAAAATMILVEEGELGLDEPVDRLLPELADRKVLKRLDGPLEDTVPANRAITVRDLLTFRMGFGQPPGPPDARPIEQAVAEQELMTLGPPTPPTPLDPDEWMRRFGTLPLMHQPGERWMYNSGSHVLGVLLARASGQPLEAFLRERLFEPLGMHDTAFSVPAAKLDRLASCYLPDPATGTLELFDGVDDSQWSRPPTFPDAAGGLVSTADDYLAFGRMLLDHGEYGGERILCRDSVEAMTTDQLTPEQKAVSGFYPGFFDTRGWGFGVAIATEPDDVTAVPGRFGWNGGFGTSWVTDPGQDLVAMLLTQRLGFPDVWDLYRDFWTSAYQSLQD